MGSLLRLPIVSVHDPAELYADLERQGARQVRAATRGGARYDAFDWTPPVALWVASETGALPTAAERAAPVSIPMAGPVESLNVTVAAGVLLFAARAGVRA
jgi:23S rRNA (guanosine2251-2'-O)-methyltransferase